MARVVERRRGGARAGHARGRARGAGRRDPRRRPPRRASALECRDRRRPPDRVSCAPTPAGIAGIDVAGRPTPHRPRVDPAQPAQHGPAGRRARVPVAGARSRGGRLGAGAADGRRASPTTSTATSPAGSTSTPRWARSSTRSPTGSTSSPSSSASALRDIIPWWVAVLLPLRDLLLWGLVPFLRTRGYSALPGALPRQGRDVQPALRLPAAAARRRRGHRRRRWPRSSAGRSRSGASGSTGGPASSTPGRCARCCATTAATAPVATRWLTDAPERPPRPLPAHVTTPLLTLHHRSSRWTRTTPHVAAAAERGGGSRTAGPPQPALVGVAVVAVLRRCSSASPPCRPPATPASRTRGRADARSPRSSSRRDDARRPAAPGRAT